MYVDLKGKNVLITGGSSGIGLGLADALGALGANVIIVARDVIKGKNAEEELRSRGIMANFIPVDVTCKKQVVELISKSVNMLGTLDILINNAGINIRKALIDIEEDDWDQVIGINLKGSFLVGQAAAKQMIIQNSGTIINISSILGGIGFPLQSSYAASKGGLNQLTKVWAEELAPYNITVNAISPGYIETNINQQWLSDPKRRQIIENSTMLKRLGNIKDLYGLVLLLVSESSRYITGQIINVDGGWRAGN